VAAAEFDGPASERSCRVSAAEIGGNEVCYAALGLDRGDDRVAARGVTATDEHMGAPIGQREGGGFADAAVAPVIRAVLHARSVVLMRSLFWIFEVFTRMSLGDKAVDGLVGVVLEGQVGQVGEDVRLVDQGTGDRVGRAAVENATRQGRVGDAVDQSPRAHVKFVGHPQGGYDVLGRYTQR